ncbi:MAG: biotin/lipoyl-binding protein, partial [Phycisphaerales bacterium JB041]
MGKVLWIGGAVVAVGVVGAGVALTQTSLGETLKTRFERTEEPATVRVETVGRSDVTRSVSAPGLVEPRTKVEISAQVSARIVALPFEEGDIVRAGDVVVRLDSEDLTARLEGA